jgi:hypothetical protein
MRPNLVKQLILGVLAAVVLMTGVLTTTAEAQTQTQARKGARRPPRVIIYRPYYRHYSPFYDPFYDPFWGHSYWGPTYRVVDPIAQQREAGYGEGKNEGEKDAKKGVAANLTGNKDYLNSDSLVFREAFVKGYEDGYREELADLREKGLKEGRDEGKKDAKKGRPANPTGNEDYLKYGSLAYREAFVRGYHERYQEQMRERANN